MNLLQTFKAYIQSEDLFHKNDFLLLAISGGVDSVVLCELCRQAGFHFAIAHCNFQLRGEDSTRDENFVNQLAEKYRVTIFSKTFNTIEIAREQKKSIEETARDLRYEWFYALIAAERQQGMEAVKPSDKELTVQQGSIHELSTSNLKPPTYYILTAHHANDNIETVIMNFFRGTGIKGLRGILPKQQKIVRPLLFATRKEIEDFAKENALDFVVDRTNAESDYTRNYFRNELIPAVKKIYPGTEENILKNIQRFSETEELYNQSVEIHKKKLIERKGEEWHIPVLKLLKTIPLKTVLFEIIKDFGFTSHQTEEVIALLKSESGKYIQSSSHRVIRHRKWLIISPNATTEAENILIEKGTERIDFSAGTLVIAGKSVTHFKIPESNMVAALDTKEITYPFFLRKWKTGDYFYPLGMNKKKKLSRFFIDQKLSLTEKENIWVIEMNKKIIWIVGMRIDNRFKITPATKNILQITYNSR